jgi:DNA-binding Xre family transcriptional regulator
MQEIALEIILVLCMLPSCDPPDLVISHIIFIFMPEIALNIILVLCRLASCDPSDLVIFPPNSYYARNRIGHNIGTVQVALL